MNTITAPIPHRGLSPLAWGNLGALVDLEDGKGSIPTRVGEPIVSYCQSMQNRVYPHSRGGTVEFQRPKSK